MAENIDTSLTRAWPREHRLDRRRFELLKRACIEARYSDPYEITTADLLALSEAAAQLKQPVEANCSARIEALAAARNG